MRDLSQDTEIITRLMPGDDPPTPSTPDVRVVALGETAPSVPSADLSVPPADLRAAAGACSAIEQDLREPIRTAIRQSKDAAGALKGWRVGAQMASSVDDWHAALDALRQRVGRTGQLISDAANGHEWNQDRIVVSFDQNEDVD